MDVVHYSTSDAIDICNGQFLPATTTYNIFHNNNSSNKNFLQCTTHSPTPLHLPPPFTTIIFPSQTLETTLGFFFIIIMKCFMLAAYAIVVIFITVPVSYVLASLLDFNITIQSCNLLILLCTLQALHRPNGWWCDFAITKVHFSES